MKRSLDGLASKGYYLSDHLSVLVLDMYVCQTYFNETSLSSYKFFDGMFALPFFLHKVGLLDLMMQRRSLRDIVTLETAQKLTVAKLYHRLRCTVFARSHSDNCFS